MSFRMLLAGINFVSCLNSLPLNVSVRVSVRHPDASRSVVVLFINPVEMLKKSRDVQRTCPTSLRQNRQSCSICKTAQATTWAARPIATPTNFGTTDTSGKIKMSLRYATAGLKPSSNPAGESYNATTTADLYKNNAQGWIPYIDFTTFASGHRLKNFPLTRLTPASPALGAPRTACTTATDAKSR